MKRSGIRLTGSRQVFDRTFTFSDGVGYAQPGCGTQRAATEITGRHFD
jgi:hypothetical protein